MSTSDIDAVSAAERNEQAEGADPRALKPRTSLSVIPLYALADEYLEAAHKLAELDIDEQTIADTLESISGPLEEKATNVAAFVRNLEASAEAIKDAEAQMAARRKALEARAERVREYLRVQMERVGIKRIESPWFVVALRQNPPRVVVAHQSELPPEMMRQPPPPPPEVNKRLIADLLKAGKDVPGAYLETSNRVEIK